MANGGLVRGAKRYKLQEARRRRIGQTTYQGLLEIDYVGELGPANAFHSA
jgi:hypothetical protein